MADEHGIPWQGKIPTEVKYFREKTSDSWVLMGYTTYTEFKAPLSNRRNFVASSKPGPLREGFELVHDARQLLENASGDIWVIGGAGLFASTLDLADELYITQLDGDFNCTKFFPKFDDQFKLKSKSEPQTENGIDFHYEVWVRR